MVDVDLADLQDSGGGFGVAKNARDIEQAGHGPALPAAHADEVAVAGDDRNVHDRREPADAAAPAGVVVTTQADGRRTNAAVEDLQDGICPSGALAGLEGGVS